MNQNSMGSNFTDVGAGGAGGGYANLGGNGGGEVESSGGLISGHLDSLSSGSVGLSLWSTFFKPPHEKVVMTIVKITKKFIVFFII